MPNLPINPCFDICGSGCAHFVELVRTSGTNIKTAITALDCDNLYAKIQQHIAHGVHIISGKEPVHFVAGLISVLLEFRAVQHVENFLGAGEENIKIRPQLRDCFFPVYAPTRRVRIGKRHVQRCSYTQIADALIDFHKLRTIIFEHSAHQRGISEMEKPRLGDLIVVDVVSTKAVVGRGAVEEHTVVSVGAKNHRIAGIKTLTDN